MNMILRVLCLCSLAILVHSYAKYEESEARGFFDLAAATYANPADDDTRNKCFQRSFASYQFRTVMAQNVECDWRANKCNMYVAYSANSDTYVIAYRGTDGLSQLFDEMKTGVQKYIDYTDGPAGNQQYIGKVNKYFYNVLDSTFWDNAIIPAIKTRTATTKFWITGHSLGGSLAALTAFRLSVQGLVPMGNIRMISYGEPRTGDWNFAQNYQAYVPNSWRVIHYEDPIPHLPPNEDLSSTPGKPYHHAREIWYTNEKMTSHKECDEHNGEDRSCSDKSDFKIILNFFNNEHLKYFGTKFPDYGVHGCSASGISVMISLLFALYKLL